MHLRTQLANAILAALCLAFCVPGCAEPKVMITGKVLKNGEPAKIANDTLVTLVFAPDDTQKGQTYPARFDRDKGTYQAEFPPGKYRVSYVIAPKGEAPISAPRDMATKAHDFMKAQEFNIDIGTK